MIIRKESGLYNVYKFYEVPGMFRVLDCTKEVLVEQFESFEHAKNYVRSHKRESDHG